MEIKKEHLATLWLENEDGEKYIPTEDELYDLWESIARAENEGFIYQYSRFPSCLEEHCLRIITQKEVNECDHPENMMKPDLDIIEGMEGRECAKCGGAQCKKVGEEWPDKWEAYGSREVFRTSQTWSEDLVLAMANSGDYTLGESILIASKACERCMNALAFKYGLLWGYAELSDEWKKSGTSCKFCEGMGYSAIVRIHEDGTTSIEVTKPDGTTQVFPFMED